MEKVTGSKSKGATQYYFYYHCNHCQEFRASAELVNESVVKLLRKIKVEPKVKELYKAVFASACKEVEGIQKEETKNVNSEIEKINTRKKHIQDLLGDAKMEVEQFGEMMKRFNSELEKLTGKREKESETTSQKELQIKLSGVLNFIENISKCYETADLNKKQQIVSSTFTGKLTFDGNESRTMELNEVIDLLSLFGKAFKGKKKRPSENFYAQSPGVDPQRIELWSKQALNGLSTCLAYYCLSG